MRKDKDNRKELGRFWGLNDSLKVTEWQSALEGSEYPVPAQDIGTFLPVCVLLEIQIFLICKMSYYEVSSVHLFLTLEKFKLFID